MPMTVDFAGKRTAGGKRKMVFRGLPRACWEFFECGVVYEEDTFRFIVT